MKTDCLNYNKHGKSCVALNLCYCSSHECKFYKNKAMLDELVRKVRQYNESYVPYKDYVPG